MSSDDDMGLHGGPPGQGGGEDEQYRNKWRESMRTVREAINLWPRAGGPPRSPAHHYRFRACAVFPLRAIGGFGSETGAHIGRFSGLSAFEVRLCAATLGLLGFSG